MRKVHGVTKRITAFLLSAAMLLGLFPALSTRTEAAAWMQPYLDQVVDWGVMRGDLSGNLNPDRQITRAEFVTMVNRAFGYKELGPNPFSDVPDTAWYAEDIRIAYKAGYFNGTTPTTASPNNLVTREQAAVLIGRNLRLQGGVGETTGFTDSRQMGDWSRGLVQEAAGLGIIQGYEDGSFRPKNPITRGQVAVFLTRALGTLIQEPGEYSNMGVYSNLTINTPGVTLKDSIITGNLYLTGGVGLENVELENVTVQGKIVVCGAGESQKGESSVMLRNVTADALEVDSLSNQFLTVRAEGLTSIGTTTVRTDAYLEDLTNDNLGLRLIQLDGADGTGLQLAGNIKEFVNLTPGSTVNFAQGVVHKATVDEKATGSTINIDGTAMLKELNLDVGTTVIGSGDIDHLNVYAPGSTVTMLPDTITIRPGVTANIYEEEMDTQAAVESSEDPRILAGYPAERNVAPKSAEVAFSTNKKGTLYWGLTALADGSIGEEDLVNPPSYSSNILKSGTIEMEAAKTEEIAKLSGLTTGGSYYVSAVLEDNRGYRSPVKVAAFTTPDDTTPAFSSGYPKTVLTEDDDENIILQAQVMANKDCRLYYALLPEGSTAPKAADFKSAAISGSLGYGSEDLKKNTPWLVSQVNTSRLKEQTTYDLYLWLTDIDGAKSSSVKKIEVTTQDKTSPKIQHLTVTGVEEKRVTLTYALDEPGTFFWAVVKQGVQFYQADANGKIPEYWERIAQIQVESGVGALKKGKSNASKALTDYNFTVSGLEAQTTYDLYFVAKDKAGNYSVYSTALTPPFQIKTLDTEGPTVEQEFTRPGSEEGEPITPYPDTSIRLIFSENVQGIIDESGELKRSKFLELYQTSVQTGNASDRKALADALAQHIQLYRVPTSGPAEPVEVRGADGWVEGDPWVIDYSKATVYLDPQGTGQMIVSFPFDNNPSDLSESALNLSSGTTYYWALNNIADLATAENRMKGDPGEAGVKKLEEFTTIDAQIVFSRGTSSGTLNNDSKDELLFDMNFLITPVTAANVNPDTVWDLMFWTTHDMDFELYYRDTDDTLWTQLGTGAADFGITTRDTERGLSMSQDFAPGGKTENHDVRGFEKLSGLTSGDREYGIIITRLGDSTTRTEWSGTVSMDVVAVSGDSGAMSSVAVAGTPDKYAELQKEETTRVKEIGVPKEYTLTCAFRDTLAPTFANNYPAFTPGDAGVSIGVSFNRACTAYWVIAEAGHIPTTLRHSFILDGDGNVEDYDELKLWQNSAAITTDWEKLPRSGGELETQSPGNATLPTSSAITGDEYDRPGYIIGYDQFSSGYDTIDIPDGLDASTEYVAYFVLQGESSESISDVYAFGFRTEEVVRPVLSVQLPTSGTAIISSDREAEVHYLLMVAGRQGDPFSRNFGACVDQTSEAWKALDEEDQKRYAAMSVLEAMQATVTQGNLDVGSVFDFYATKTVKDMASDAIVSGRRDGQTVVSAGNADLNNSNDLRHTQDFTGDMSGDALYWVVATGKSPLGSGYAFAANAYLSVQDNQHPLVTSLSTTLDENCPVTDQAGDVTDPVTGTVTQGAFNRAYSGTVTVVFDETLHYKQGETNWPQIIDIATLPTLPAGYTKSYIASSRLLNTTKAAVIPTYNTTDNPLPANESDLIPCSILTFEYDGVRPGESINFVPNLSDDNGNTGSSLSLILTLEPNSYGMFWPDFKIAYGSSQWDATGGTLTEEP